jgi:MFS family permease
MRLARSRFYYGWWIVGVLMVGGFLAAGTSNLFMGVMLKPMTEDLGWSRSSFTGALSVSNFLAGLMTPLLGRLADRVSHRVLNPVAGLLLAAAFLALASIDGLWQFYLVFLAGCTIGGGIGTTFPSTTAAHWFGRRRGRAFGLLALTLPLGGALLAPISQALMTEMSWRWVFVVLAIAVVLLFVLPSAIIVRDRPADLGLTVEGEAVATGDAARTPSRGWTFAAAIRTRTLWLLVISLFISSMASGSVTFHQVAYFTDIGISQTAAVTALSIYAFAGAVASGLWGLLIERYSERMLATVALLLSAVLAISLLFVSNAAQAIAFAFLFGLMARGGGALRMSVILEYYGRDFYGSISSLVTSAQSFGLAIGPLIASLVFDSTGSYDQAFLLFVVLFLVAALLVWEARRPVQEPAALVAMQ